MPVRLLSSYLRIAFLFCLLLSSRVLFGQAVLPQAQSAAERKVLSDSIALITNSPWATTVKLKCGNPLVPCASASSSNPAPPPPHIGNAAPITPDLSNNPADYSMRPVSGMGVVCGVGTGGNGCARSTDENLKAIGENPVSGEEARKRLHLPGPTPAVPSPPQGSVLVLWESASPVRAARAQFGMLDSPKAQKANGYVISIVGYPMRAAVGPSVNLNDPRIQQAILQSVTLNVRGKPPIHASDVELADNENSMTVRYFFPKEQQLQLGDKEVVVNMQVLLGDIVEAHFDLKRMVYEGKPALLSPPVSAVAPAEQRNAVNIPTTATENSPSESRMAEEHYSRAGNLMAAGRYDDAIAELRLGLTVLPSDASAHYNLGVCLAAKRMLAEAVAEYRTAIGINPKHIKARQNLGDVLDDLGDHEQAVEVYRKALELEPDRLSLHGDLVIALQRLRRWDDVRKESQWILNRNPDSSLAHYNLAQAFEHEGNEEAAIAHYRDTVRLNDRNADAHFDLGRLLQNRGDTEAALFEFQRACLIAPGSAVFCGRHSALRRQLGR